MKIRKKKILLYLSFFVVLIIGFWALLFYDNDNWRSKLPVIGFVQPYQFTNQNGESVTKQQANGKVQVSNYFFATCTGICPNMNNKLKQVYEAFKGNQDVLFISHTCQPENDSLPVLKAYQDSIGADGRQWQFVTGNKLELYKTARESYHIDDPRNNVGKIEDQFLHSQFLALVDKGGRVRGIYDGLKQDEINKLKTDIRDLLKENSAQFANSIFTNNLQ